MLLLLSLLSPARAEAWGERAAVRSCGTNWISSWAVPGGGHSRTQRVSGSCNDRLGAGLRVSSGYFPMAFASTINTAIYVTKPGSYIGGVHAGCPSCGYSST